MAAQALVRESYRDPLATYATNVLGTGILLQACRALRQLQCVLIVTSDKVYENHGEGRAFVEGDRLGGHDPYSNSKACAELVTGSFRDSFFTRRPADRYRARRQCHRRRRLVAGSSDSGLRSGARGRRAGLFAISRGDPALAACAGTAVGLSDPRAGPGAGAGPASARCQFRPGPVILLHGARGG